MKISARLCRPYFPAPRWSQLCLTPLPPRPFLPSYNSNYSMVMQYQGSNQSMDNPLQNQQWHEEDMVDSAPCLAGDSALLQQHQQLRKNRSEASDWRPRGGGIMKLNNQGFEESNMGFEEESEEMMMMNCISFPPSPTDFPLYLPLPSLSNSTLFSVKLDLCNRFEHNVRMVLSDEGNNSALDWMNKMEQEIQDILHMFKDKSGVLNVINWLKHEDFFRWIEGSYSYMENNVTDLDRIIGAKGMMPEDVVLLVQNIWQQLIQNREGKLDLTLRRMNWFEQHDVEIVDQPVLEMVGLVQQLIQSRGDKYLDLIPGGGVCTINGLEHSNGQGLPMTTERSLIFHTKFVGRVWLGYGGRWVVEIRLRQRLEDATFALETVMKWSGWMDLTGFPGLFQKANRSKLPLQLPLPAQEEEPYEDFGLVRCNARGNDEIEAIGTGSEGTWNCVMAHQARLNLGKRKTKEKNPGGGRSNKKTNGVRIAIPLEDILQTKGMRLNDAANHLEVSRSTLKRVCRKYGILSWPPSEGNEHICQSCPKETPAVVDQEGVQQLNCEILPSDRALAANVDTNSVVLKARWVDDIIVKIRLPKPWKMAELEQQVKKRLKLESGTYYIRYKDEENELITIFCDEDLEEYISSSRRLDTSSIEVFLVPK